MNTTKDSTGSIEGQGTVWGRFLRRAAEAAQGTGIAVDAFRELGIEPADKNGRPREGGALLYEVAEAFHKVPNHADKLRLGFRLFDMDAGMVLTLIEVGGVTEASKMLDAWREDHGGSTARITLCQAQEALVAARALVEAVHMAAGSSDMQGLDYATDAIQFTASAAQDRIDNAKDAIEAVLAALPEGGAA